jgi:hypothetical protein
MPFISRGRALRFAIGFPACDTSNWGRASSRCGLRALGYLYDLIRRGRLAERATGYQFPEQGLLGTCTSARWVVADVQWEVAPKIRVPIQGVDDESRSVEAERKPPWRRRGQRVTRFLLE